MAENSKIAWCNDTINFWWGCEKIAPGCKDCYAQPIAARFFGDLWGATKPRGYIESAHATCRKLNRKAEREGTPRLVFVNSMSDFFEEHSGPIIDRKGRVLIQWEGSVKLVTGGHQLDMKSRTCCGNPIATLDDLRREAFQTIDECQWLRFLLLTKRPENILRMWDGWETNGYGEASPDFNAWPKPRPNVWLGTSIANQADADENIPKALQARELSPALFVSAEPLLGPVDFSRAFGCSCGLLHPRSDGLRTDFVCDLHDDCLKPQLDQVIIGVESDGARVGRLGEFKTEQDWITGAIDIVGQCQQAGVAAFVKQIPQKGMVSHDPAHWPKELQVREYPAVREPAHAD